MPLVTVTLRDSIVSSILNPLKPIYVSYLTLVSTHYDQRNHLVHFTEKKNGTP